MLSSVIALQRQIRSASNADKKPVIVGIYGLPGEADSVQINIKETLLDTRL